MKRIISLLLTLLLLCGMTACGTKGMQEEEPPADNTMVANPWVEYDTRELAIAAAGFDMTAPESMEGYDAPIYRVMNAELLEVLYQSAAGEVRIRKAVGEEDISGDHNTYEETQTIATPGEDGVVTMAGSGGAVACATWHSGAYTYAITADPGLDVPAVADLVNAVH